MTLGRIKELQERKDHLLDLKKQAECCLLTIHMQLAACDRHLKKQTDKHIS